jgi:hypothetical protein
MSEVFLVMELYSDGADTFHSVLDAYKEYHDAENAALELQEKKGYETDLGCSRSFYVKTMEVK